MKKFIIVSLLFVSLLSAPVFVHAQTASIQTELTQQLISLLMEVIARLQQQIADILDQQALQTNTIQQQTQAINQIQQNTQQIVQNTTPNITPVVTTASATPVINLTANGSTVSPIIVNTNGTVSLSWSVSNAKNEQMQCTANGESISLTGNKEVAIPDAGLTFKVICTSSSGSNSEKYIRIDTPGIFTLSVDGGSPTSAVGVSDQNVKVSFKETAHYNKITVQELRFQISQGAEIVRTDNNSGLIFVGGDSLDSNTSRRLDVYIPLKDLSNIPTSGQTIQLTNVYAKYTKADGTVVETTTPGQNNTQAMTTLLVTK